MKKTLGTLALGATLVLPLTSCGIKDALSQKCGSKGMCGDVLGYRDHDQDRRLDELERRLGQLVSVIAGITVRVDSLEGSHLDVEQRLIDLETDVASLSTQLPILIDTIIALETDLATTISSLNALIALIPSDLTDILDDLTARIEALENADYQGQINFLIIQLAELESDMGDSVAHVWDPCGNTPGHYDEVILQTNSGKFIAYFEVGQGQGNQKRFLSVLGNGTFQTTDHQACVFTVNGDVISPAVKL